MVDGTISHAERQIKPLLEQGKHTIKPGPAMLRTLAELTANAAAHGITLNPAPKQRVDSRQAPDLNLILRCVEGVGVSIIG